MSPDPDAASSLACFLVSLEFVQHPSKLFLRTHESQRERPVGMGLSSLPGVAVRREAPQATGVLLSGAHRKPLFVVGPETPFQGHTLVGVNN